ncbi:MAG: TRAM domain-containing protein [Nitrosopumilus sp.]
MNGRMQPPVNQGDKISVVILNEGNNPNTRVAKVDGYVIFIQDCTIDKDTEVVVEITAALPRYGFAKVVTEEEAQVDEVPVDEKELDTTESESESEESAKDEETLEPVND